MSKLCRSVRGGRLGSVGANCPRLGLLWEAVHPIRRHYTPSDRVHREGVFNCLCIRLLFERIDA